MNNKYTDERNSQIVISLLKAHHIKYIVTSPGTTHMCFVGSVQHDAYFKVFSCVDERSAGYMACGIAAETGEPVVITCTGATASRNYYSPLTEAYYRKLPIIAITAHQGSDRIGHLMEQNIDRRRLPSDIAKISVDAVYVHDKRDEHYCEIEVNKAILESVRHGGGPVHINLFTRYSKNFSVDQLPPVKVINRYTAFVELPNIPKGKVAVFIGSHRKFAEEENKAIDSFCATHNAVVFCDHTSGYSGNYKVHFSLALAQQFCQYDESKVDLLIHIGEVSGDATSRKLCPQMVWRVSEDGEIRDTWGRLKNVFEMSEKYFFDYYTNTQASEHGYYDQCKRILDKLRAKTFDIPLSNIWVAQQLMAKMPEGSTIHTGIWSSLRSMNFFETVDNIHGNCNVGGFGIDGNMSSLIGASISAPEKMFFGLVGDLAFFYDMNVLGNRHIGNNLRIVVVNNGRGNEMRYSFSPASALGEDGNLFLAASGHYSYPSKNVIKNYVESLGYQYISASSKEEVLSQLDDFLFSARFDKSIVFEIFIDDYKDEDRAYQEITLLEKDQKTVITKEIKSVLKNTIGSQGVKIAKKILGK